MERTNVDNLIALLPKAELHLHIEGTFEPELMFAIAKRNGLQLAYDSVAQLKEAYQFSDLQDFLDLYYSGVSVLLHERDYYELTWAYLKSCDEQNIRHTEIMFDPQAHTQRGVAFETVINGICRACDEAKEKLGVSSFLIMSYLRHLSEESAFETLEMSRPYKDKIKAVGLDSSEKGNPPSKFERVFRASVEMGYIPLAHAGEEGDASYVEDALDLLKVVRIDHGNRSLDDSKLVKRLIREDIALTVCPLSNLALQVVPCLEKHPLRNMLDLGLAITLNSDDPAYFGGNLNANFGAVSEAQNLSTEEIVQLAKNSFRYSLLDEKTKQAFLNEISIFVRNKK